MSSLRVAVYASEGRDLHALALDPRHGALRELGTVTFPEIVQYAAIDRARGRLYVSLSDRAARHFLAALVIDAATGSLRPHGDPLAVDERVIHLSVDPAGGHLVLAHPLAGRLAVASLHPDGRMKAVEAGTEIGYFAHQAELVPEGLGLVACVMGSDAQDRAPEKPGRLVAFRYQDGRLEETARVTFPAGRGPRHLDYAHGRVYVAVERGNRLAVFEYAHGTLDPSPRFDVTTLADPDAARPGQRAGAIHFHPNGRWLYVTNRGGAVNDIALFDVDPATGAPTPRAYEDSRGVEPRTFTIDPTGSFLIVANHSPGPGVARNWAVFRIGDDGRLAFVRGYDRADDLFWIGSAAVP